MSKPQEFRCTIEGAVLLSALRDICRIVPTKTFAPIVTHAWMRFEGKRLLISGSDLDRTLTIDCVAEGVGAVTVPAHRLYSFASLVEKGAQVCLALDGTSLVAKSGRARHQLPTLPVADYPVSVADAVKSKSKWTADAKRLALAIRALTPATAKDDNRQYLSGIHFDIGADAGSRFLAATDTAQMGVETAPWIEGSGEGKFIVPTEALAPIQTLCEGGGEIEIAVSEGAASFGSSGRIFRTKLIDGKFPDYRRIIPRDTKNAFTMKASDLVSVLRRGANIPDASKVTSEYSLVSLSFENGSLSVSADSVEGEHSSDTSDCEVRRGGSVSFGCWLPRLIWAVDSLRSDADIEIQIADDKTPILIRNVDDDDSIRVIAVRVARVMQQKAKAA